jgi:hypothetical protein
MPDQQADAGEDPWEVAPSDAEGDSEKEEERATDVPDTDEAGTGRQGAPHPATVNPEHPMPEEPSA